MKDGYILQVMDFAMNFNNHYQDEVQSAYWSGTQMTIHGTINFFNCMQQGCDELVMLALVHITDDLKHYSFLVRAAQNLTFHYLVDLDIPLHLIVQFCDNCSAQYKSRRPFAEMARSALSIICVYFGEKHGKSHSDALFGHLKAWMWTDAYDFYKHCREFYQMPIMEDDCCQHYRVEFQFIRPSDVKRHQDCDLDQRVEHTHDCYSMRNTPRPLELKVRYIPCLCPSCIADDGSKCFNSDYVDPLKTVQLIPKKGSNKNKYEKRKCPDAHILAEHITTNAVNENNEDLSSDEELPEISFDVDPFKKWQERRNSDENAVTDSVTDQKNDHVTDRTVQHGDSVELDPSDKNSSKAGNTKFCTWKNVEEEITADDFITPVSNQTVTLKSLRFVKKVPRNFSCQEKIYFLFQMLIL